MMNSPVALVFTLRLAPVPVFTIITWAPAITAPELSVTIPPSCADETCAYAPQHVPRHIPRITAQRQTIVPRYRMLDLSIRALLETHFFLRTVILLRPCVEAGFCLPIPTPCDQYVFGAEPERF